jgi:hypothetical protein
MRSCNGVKVVATVAVAIAVLLLRARASLAVLNAEIEEISDCKVEEIRCAGRILSWL